MVQASRIFHASTSLKLDSKKPNNKCRSVDLNMQFRLKLTLNLLSHTAQLCDALNGGTVCHSTFRPSVHILFCNIDFG